MHLLKEELSIYKNKLSYIESQLQDQIHSVEDKTDKWKKEEDIIKALLQENGNKIITFNISGTIFKTKLKTLSVNKESLFYKLLIHNKDLDFSEVFYFDTDPFWFEVILNFIRYSSIDFSRFDSEQKHRLLIEAEFFEVKELINKLNRHLLDVELISFEFNAPYVYQGKKVGTNLIDDLNDKSLMKGICAMTPGCITFELSNESTLNSLLIAGYNGNTQIWNKDQGEGATISISKDKQTWTNIGTVPTGFGSEIKLVKLLEESGKYLRFSSTSHLGIGYLKVM